MTLKHNDLHLHALYKLAPALPKHLAPAKRKYFLGKKKKRKKKVKVSPAPLC